MLNFARTLGTLYDTQTQGVPVPQGNAQQQQTLDRVFVRTHKKNKNEEVDEGRKRRENGKN